MHAAIVDLVAAGWPVDAAGVASHLARQNGVGRDSDRAALLTLEANCPAPSNARAYLLAVRDWGRRRRVLSLASQLGEIGMRGGGVDGVFAQLEGLDHEQSLDESTWGMAVGLIEVLEGKSVDLEPTVLVRDDGLCLIYPGKIHLFAGEPETGKSWLLLHACLEQIEVGRHAFYVDFEDDLVTTARRLLTLGARQSSLAERFHYFRPTKPLTRPAWGQFARELDRHKPALVVLDGLTEALTIHDLDLLSNRDVATFFGLVARPIARHGPAVAIIDHVTKNPEHRGRWAIGAQHKLGGIDGASYGLEVVKPVVRGRDGLVRVLVNKDRPGYVRRATAGKVVAEMRTSSSGDLLEIELVASRRVDPEHPERQAWQPTTLMDRVSRWLEIHPGSTGSEIRQGVRGKNDWKAEALRALVAGDHVAVENGLHGANVYRVVQPFRAGPEVAE